MAVENQLSFLCFLFLDYFVRVYDGNAAYKRHAYRAVPFSKNLTAHAVLGLALKALHMTFHSKSFKICEISEKGKIFPFSPSKFTASLMLYSQIFNE